MIPASYREIASMRSSKPWQCKNKFKSLTFPPCQHSQTQNQSKQTEQQQARLS